MSVKSPANFAAGVLLPALSLGLALSLGVNGILLATRFTAEPKPIASQQSAQPVLVATPDSLPPRGFGDVGQGMRMLAQKLDGMPTGAFRYVLTKGMLPSLPASFTLYRDQGVTADSTPFIAILNAMKVPLNFSDLRLLPDDISFTTPDNVFSILVNVRDRTLEVSRNNRSPDDVSDTPVNAPLSDDRMIAIAESMAQELGIDTSSLGTPSVIKIYRTVEAGSVGKVLAPGMEEVRWPLLFSGYPVVDDVGRPVSGMSVFVAHRSQQAVALNMHIISTDLLSHAEYPSADPALIAGFALEGGMAPIDGNAKGKSVTTVTYESAQLVYVLPQYRADRPTYVFPAIAFSSDIPRTCKVKPCTPWTWTTYVPALDPKTFAWLPGTMSSSSVAPASSAAASSVPAVSSSADAKSSSVSSVAPVASSAPAVQASPNDGLQILR